MNNQPKKLELSKETLRGLDDDDLTGVVGGGGHGGGGGSHILCSVGCESVVCSVVC
jgi:hypothetical protein